MRTHSSELQKTQREVQNKLALRIDDIELRKKDLLLSIENTETEIGELSIYKQRVETTIKEKEKPLAVALECQQARQKRQSCDLLEDDVDVKLAEEVNLLHQVQELFQKKHSETVEQLRLLRAVVFQLREDLKDKTISHHIDSNCAELDTTRPDIGLFRDTVRISATGEKASLPEQWEQFTDVNIGSSFKEIQKSVSLREELDFLFKETAADLLAASNHVEDAFNSRLVEYTEARSVAQQHLAKIQIEISVQDRNIGELKEALDSRDAPLKLATTRLERRQQRPNIELVKDSAQGALVREVGTLDLSVEELRARLQQAEETLRALLRSQGTLEADVACKGNSINIDNSCMLSRQQLKYAAV